MSRSVHPGWELQRIGLVMAWRVHESMLHNVGARQSASCQWLCFAMTSELLLPFPANKLVQAMVW
jgi:hypothetical protein